jgi:hypothetical protein
VESVDRTTPPMSGESVDGVDEVDGVDGEDEWVDRGEGGGKRVTSLVGRDASFLARARTSKRA